MNVNRIAAIVVAAFAALALSACGSSTTLPAGGSSSGSQASAPHNEADVTFARGMVPHHTQAVQMSELAADRAASPQVKGLATTISRAQGPEIEQMQGFLRSWGQPAASGGMGGMGGMDQGMRGMVGMMTDQQMQQLDGSKGAAFDRMFLQMMIEHHTGAISMAETEIRDGQNAEAKALAQKIIGDQRAEIEQMRQLLTTV